MATTTKKTETKVEKSTILKVPEKSFYGTGRRKNAIAKVWLFPGKGTIELNKQTVIEYIKRDVLYDLIKDPLVKLKLEGKYDIKISTLGGGLTGQAGAAQLGISRAILAMDEDYRRSLREHGFLTRDTRIKERKKYGKRGARKAPQYRKR